MLSRNGNPGERLPTNETQMASIAELNEAPEVAVLTVLDVALGQLTAVLVHAHPELTSAECLLDMENPEPAVWLADAMLNTANSLSRTIRRYREAVALRKSWAIVPTRDEDIPF